MENNDIQTDSRSNSSTSYIGQFVWRLITSAIILAITAFFTPGFSINNIWSLGLAAVTLTVIDYLLSTFTGLHASSFGRGLIGFILAVVTLYIVQYIVAGYSISWMAAIVGALIYGVIDYFIPENQ